MSNHRYTSRTCGLCGHNVKCQPSRIRHVFGQHASRCNTASPAERRYFKKKGRWPKRGKEIDAIDAKIETYVKKYTEDAGASSAHALKIFESCGRMVEAREAVVDMAKRWHTSEHGERNIDLHVRCEELWLAENADKLRR